jgi:CMP-N,N'-diacetyllegionaminic acid synthase
METIGIIPARGGSKGVPRKNIANLAGKPLIAYTIEAALSAKLLSNVIVSTEDKEIAQVSKKYGVEVPFTRPEKLATDTAPMLPVLQHAVKEMETRTNQVFDIVVLLQPSTPLRLASDIDNGIKLLHDTGADSVISIVDVNANHPFRMKRVVGDNILVNYIEQGFEDMRPRQTLPLIYIRSGDLYISRRDVIMKEDKIVGDDARAYIIPEERTVNIDKMSDFYFAEYLIKKQKENGKTTI